MNERKGLTGSTLKIIAIVTMLIDHIGATLVERTMYANGYIEAMAGITDPVQWMMIPKNLAMFFLDIFMRLTGRIAFPIFAFLLVEGFMHTHSKSKYILRMAIFSLIAEIPFNLAIDCSISSIYYQSVFVTLTISLLVLWGMETLKNKDYSTKLHNILKYVSFFMFGWFTFFMFMGTFIATILASYVPVESWNVSYEIFGHPVPFPNMTFILCGCVCGLISEILFIVLTKKKDNNAVLKEAMSWFPVYGGLLAAEMLMTDYAGIGVLTVVLMYIFRDKKVKAMLAGCITLTLMSFMEFTTFIDLIFISQYNGKRGLQIKYFFYIFYPAHLLILYLIGHFALGVM